MAFCKLRRLRWVFERSASSGDPGGRRRFGCAGGRQTVRDWGRDGNPLGKRWRETGSFEAKSVKGQSRSPLKKHEDWLLELVRREPDLTREEIQRRLLDERQQKAGIGSVWRFFDRHGISFKKSIRAAE
jgi:transposase